MCTIVFFFNHTATTEIYTLSLHDALPISPADPGRADRAEPRGGPRRGRHPGADRKSTRLNSSHTVISYAVFCLKKKKQHAKRRPPYRGVSPHSAGCCGTAVRGALCHP